MRVPDVANAAQDYGGTRAIDHDDGSKFFIDEENVLVGSGVKNFLGNTKHFIGNLMIGAGEKGICCYQSDGGNGHANHIFANNTCIYSGDGCRLSHAAHDSTSGAATRIQPYRHTVHCVPNSTQPGSPAFRAWMRNSSFASSGPPLTPLPPSLLCFRRWWPLPLDVRGLNV